MHNERGFLPVLSTEIRREKCPPSAPLINHCDTCLQIRHVGSSLNQEIFASGRGFTIERQQIISNGAKLKVNGFTHSLLNIVIV